MSSDTFAELVESKLFAECGSLNGHSYGTLRSEAPGMPPAPPSPSDSMNEVRWLVAVLPRWQLQCADV